MKIRHIGSVICLVFVFVFLAGCSHTKAAGTWVSAAADATFELKSDGTGTMGSGQTIKWTEDGNAIKVFQPTDDTNSATPVATGTLSDDQKQLTVNLSGIDTETFTRKD